MDKGYLPHRKGETVIEDQKNLLTKMISGEVVGKQSQPRSRPTTVAEQGQPRERPASTQSTQQSTTQSQGGQQTSQGQSNQEK
jgi:hypothetical protein